MLHYSNSSSSSEKINNEPILNNQFRMNSSKKVTPSKNSNYSNFSPNVNNSNLIRNEKSPEINSSYSYQNRNFLSDDDDSDGSSNIQYLRNENDSLKKIISKKDSELFQLNQKLRKAVRHIKSHKIKKELAEQEVESHSNEIITLQEELEEKDKLISQLYSEAKMFNDANVDAHNELQRITDLYKNMEDNFGGQLKMMQDKVKIVQQEKDSQIKSMKKTIVSLQSENDSLRIALTEYEAIQNSLQDDKDDIKCQNHLLHEEIDELKEKLQGSESESFDEIENLKEKNSVLINQSQELTEENEKLKETIKRLKSQSPKNISILEEIINEKDNQIQILQKELTNSLSMNMSQNHSNNNISQHSNSYYTNSKISRGQNSYSKHSPTKNSYSNHFNNDDNNDDDDDDGNDDSENNFDNNNNKEGALLNHNEFIDENENAIENNDENESLNYVSTNLQKRSSSFQNSSLVEAQKEIEYLREANQKLILDLQNQEKSFEEKNRELFNQLKSAKSVSSMNESLMHQLTELQSQNYSRKFSDSQKLSHNYCQNINPNSTFDSDTLLHEIKILQEENKELRQENQTILSKIGDITPVDLNSQTNDSLVQEFLRLKAQNEHIKNEIHNICTQSTISNSNLNPLIENKELKSKILALNESINQTTFEDDSLLHSILNQQRIENLKQLNQSQTAHNKENNGNKTNEESMLSIIRENGNLRSLLENGEISLSSVESLLKEVEELKKENEKLREKNEKICQTNEFTNNSNINQIFNEEEEEDILKSSVDDVESDQQHQNYSNPDQYNELLEEEENPIESGSDDYRNIHTNEDINEYDPFDEEEEVSMNKSIDEKYQQVCEENEELKSTIEVMQDEINDLQTHLQDVVSIQLHSTLAELDDVRVGNQALMQHTYNLELLKEENSFLRSKIMSLESQHSNLQQSLTQKDDQDNKSKIIKGLMDENENLKKELQDRISSSNRNSQMSPIKSDLRIVSGTMLENDDNDNFREKTEEMRTVLKTISKSTTATTDSSNDDDSITDNEKGSIPIDYQSIKRENAELKEMIGKLEPSGVLQGYSNTQLMDRIKELENDISVTHNQVQLLEMTNADLLQRIDDFSNNESQIVVRYEQENDNLRKEIEKLQERNMSLSLCSEKSQEVVEVFDNFKQQISELQDSLAEMQQENLDLQRKAEDANASTVEKDEIIEDQAQKISHLSDLIDKFKQETDAMRERVDNAISSFENSENGLKIENERLKKQLESFHNEEELYISFENEEDDVLFEEDEEEEENLDRNVF
ncbi:hypothetical protein TRFO_04328 [Tritrichomonas foetus]|uniref:Uncharacterized protein n=1 Tax=Tritrichomonas foetus TaxID=1144522 RepID=A0A1J4KGF4_9EUKA|nr:hypothetical protein TRFO_04328 [Tritrichomonas foetus]|eukprot:OHT10291.1 hypothetical protein TRFO_04328 [Tritrichomonas foetus]